MCIPGLQRTCTQGTDLPSVGFLTSYLGGLEVSFRGPLSEATAQPLAGESSWAHWSSACIACELFSQAFSCLVRRPLWHSPAFRRQVPAVSLKPAPLHWAPPLIPQGSLAPLFPLGWVIPFSATWHWVTPPNTLGFSPSTPLVWVVPCLLPAGGSFCISLAGLRAPSLLSLWDSAALGHTSSTLGFSPSTPPSSGCHVFVPYPLQASGPRASPSRGALAVSFPAAARPCLGLQI